MLADITQMNSMTPIGQDTLFSPAPAPEAYGTNSAPLGTVAWPTWSPGAPGTPGTILGPLGVTVPNLSTTSQGVPTTTGGSVTSAIVSGGSNIAGNGMANDGAPAGSMDDAHRSGRPLGPISFRHGWPSIVKPAPNEVGAPGPTPDFWCQFGNWVNANPLGAALGAAAIYFLLKGKKR
jgi:hypothetical protein